MRILGILVPVYAIGYALYLLNRLHCCFRSHQVIELIHQLPHFLLNQFFSFFLFYLNLCFYFHGYQQVPVLPYTIPDSESDNSSFGDDEDDDDEL